MPATNPLTTSEEEQFAVGNSDFAFFDDCASSVECAAILICRSGSAKATVDHTQGQLHDDAVMLLLPGTRFMLCGRTHDFRMSFCAFSRELFSEAAFRLAPAFFQTLHHHPISYLPPHLREGADIWFRMTEYTYRDRENMFRNTIIKNRLQNILLECYDKAQRFASDIFRRPETTSRQGELFRRFGRLVDEYSAREREVSFYADKLCISTRYLSTIVRSVVRSSAKQFIDRSAVLEIKMLLQSTDLSVQEIAYRLKFPDQSYLGRYFKKNTGLSPIAYRNSLK